MDLQTCAVIAFVFFVSFGSLWFINSNLRSGNFEDDLAVKRQLADRLYGTKHGKYSKKTGQKLNRKKKDKKERKNERKERDQQQQEEDSQNDSDVQSNSTSAAVSNNTPEHEALKAHVDFFEAEIISEDAAPVKANIIYILFLIKYILLHFIFNNT